MIFYIFVISHNPENLSERISEFLKSQLIIAYFIITKLFLISSFANSQVAGYKDKADDNFNTKAIINDGSCIYAPVSVTQTPKFVLPSMLIENSGMIFWNNHLRLQNDSDGGPEM